MEGIIMESNTELTIMEGGIIKSDPSIFEGANSKKFTTLDLTDDENKVLMYNALQQCDVKIADMIGGEIEIHNVFIEQKEVAEINEATGEPVLDEKTGDVKTKMHYRSILFDGEGKTFVSGAYGVYNSLKTILAVFGVPSDENVIKVKVGKKPTRVAGRESLILTVLK